MEHGRAEGPKDGPVFKDLEDCEEVRRGIELWVRHDLPEMLRNGINDHGWSDPEAEMKAWKALEIVLSPFKFVHPPIVRVTVLRGNPYISIHWFSNTEVH